MRFFAAVIAIADGVLLLVVEVVAVVAMVLVLMFIRMCRAVLLQIFYCGCVFVLRVSANRLPFCHNCF